MELLEPVGSGPGTTRSEFPGPILVARSLTFEACPAALAKVRSASQPRTRLFRPD
jgi:hypothetical protein